MFIIIFFLGGLLVGSFLNVLVYRLRAAEKFFWGRSKCPHCKNSIRWYDNFPVFSFLFLKFRCRDCKKKISWQYPLVEILTGIIFALISWKFFSFENSDGWLLVGFYLFSSASLISILVYDFLYMEIPSEIIWVSIFVSIFFVLYSDGTTFLFGGNEFRSLMDSKTYSGVLAAMVAFIFFFTLSFFSKEKFMGMGDVYLVVFLGPFIGWPKILLALFLAFMLGAIYGIIMIYLKKKKLKSQVPFAPFLATGTFVALFFYSSIVDRYVSLFF